MSTGRVPILMYHQVTPRPDPAFRRYTVTVRAFARQMSWLGALKYQSIDMDTLLQARLGAGTLPKRSVVITFDDGLRDCIDHVVPILQTHRFTAVFYLVAGLMGDTSRWLRSELGLDLPLIGWETARQLVADGFQCGAHTLSHPRLAGLDAARRRSELVDARARLEDELGRPVLHLAYPYGSFDEAVLRAAEDAGYRTACTTHSGFSTEHDELLALHRVPVYGGDTLVDFAYRLRTARTLPEPVRRVLQTTARHLPGRPGDAR